MQLPKLSVYLHRQTITTNLNKMKTLTINGVEYAGVQGNMSDAAFKSMLVRNDMRVEKMISLVQLFAK